MAVEQLPARVREFANYLNGLMARLDQGGGWCGVFWQRDPDGIRACLDGREVPPWDVVEALLQDLAAEYGPEAARAEAEGVRALHSSALVAYDSRPGGRDALGDRLDVMLREQRYAAERQTELGRSLSVAAGQDEADSIRYDLAWARDDHVRATARCAELRSRMAELDRRLMEPKTGAAPTEHARVPVQASAPEDGGTPKQRKRRRGSARFAGMAEEESAPVVVPPAVMPALPEQPAAGGRTPRGARFAGAAEAVEPAEPQVETVNGGDRLEVRGAVERLVRLRHEGRSGEAHALLAEITYSSPARYPLLAVELQRAGLGADWATLLWEAASLPADRLVAAADALVASGRGADAEQIMRQGVVRPADEIGRAVLGLAGQGRRREIGALLDAYVRVRTPEEAVRSVAADPPTLVPLLLEAARGVSEERAWDLVHALRVAGFAA
ncbi:hypothetical protein BN159_1998 [Streptomyces davaonensis JCM 4913]|uniref:UL36 very large tegument protein n=1 Tax=Streptomyces davaonensis (strain DSM 101723 / JCM 4913 / KCC S-0913 / 768) TaxID=1214101 RepID=K4QZP5_STRDJ|nr:hypothetical protein [Streptomyces davaonensis]CCK26377.1 hypothetical protein BN159_1998 [Streptomyces davaonensis JCM 4913]